MEQLVFALVTSLIQAIPAMVKAINDSKTLTDDQKKELLFALDYQLTEAKVTVASVRFREVDTAAEVAATVVSP